MKSNRTAWAGEEELVGRPYPCLIPEGPYLAFCRSHYWDKASRAYGERVYLSFTIFDGPHNGQIIRMFIRPSEFPTSNYYRAWAIANGCPPRSRNTKLSPRIFLRKLYRVNVVTVRPRHRIVGRDGKMRQGEFLPEHLWYSKIASLLALEVTNSTTSQDLTEGYLPDGESQQRVYIHDDT